MKTVLIHEEVLFSDVLETWDRALVKGAFSALWSLGAHWDLAVIGSLYQKQVNDFAAFLKNEGITLKFISNEGSQTAVDKGSYEVAIIPPEGEVKILEVPVVHCVEKGAEAWTRLLEKLRLPERIAKVSRKTNETDISLSLNLDGNGKADIETGLGFFDHMLEQIARHSGSDLRLKCQGDLHVDEHHSVEDTALALGEAFYSALGEKRGIDRYSFLLPMDEASATVALDFSGRSWLVWEVELKREKVGDLPTELVQHFFKSFSDAAKCTLQISARGDNEHHIIESIFKAVGKCLGQAVRRRAGIEQIPSTKGIL